jgi:hypothetical protein
VYEVSKGKYINGTVSMQRIILPVAGVINVCVCVCVYSHGCPVNDGYVLYTICSVVSMLPEII